MKRTLITRYSGLEIETNCFEHMSESTYRRLAKKVGLAKGDYFRVKEDGFGEIMVWGLQSKITRVPVCGIAVV